MRGGSKLTEEAMEGSEEGEVVDWAVVDEADSAASWGFSRFEKPTEAGGDM
jgi:hypothetical protein